MAGVRQTIATVNSTSYPTDPHLDAGTLLGSVAVAYYSAGGAPDVIFSIDGVNDAGRVDASKVPSIGLDAGRYSRVWCRLSAAGLAQAQIIIEGA